MAAAAPRWQGSYRCWSEGRPRCKLRVASFTFGFDQGMMTGRHARKHCNNFVRICAQLVEESDCDLLFACEVGGFRMGFRHAEIDLWHLLREPFGDSVQVFEIDNYVAVWNFGSWNVGGAAQPAQVSLHGCAERYTIPIAIGRDVDAAITQFDVVTSDIGMCHVVVGNMQIVCSGRRPPTIRTKKLAVRQLRDRLDDYVFEDPGIPVVRIMVGDNNLVSKDARWVLQPQTDAHPLWTVYPAPADRQGDHVAVTGAAARFQSIAVGASFQDRGMRNDCHDAVAVVITTRTAHTRSLRHARFIRAILTIVRAWHREQHVF